MSTTNSISALHCKDARGKILQYGDLVAIKDCVLQSNITCDYAEIEKWDIKTVYGGIQFLLKFKNRKVRRYSDKVLKLER